MAPDGTCSVNDDEAAMPPGRRCDPLLLLLPCTDADPGMELPEGVE